MVTDRTTPTVLFLCVHNAGRSQIAAALLEQHSRGAVRALSAGSEPADRLNPAVIAAMHERGLDLSGRLPARLTDAAVATADVVVTMGCGDACRILPGKRYIDWQVEDPAGRSLEEIRPIVESIDQRVRTLLDELRGAPPQPRAGVDRGVS